MSAEENDSTRPIADCFYYIVAGSALWNTAETVVRYAFTKPTMLPAIVAVTFGLGLLIAVLLLAVL